MGSTLILFKQSNPRQTLKPPTHARLSIIISAKTTTKNIDPSTEWSPSCFLPCTYPRLLYFGDFAGQNPLSRPPPSCFSGASGRSGHGARCVAFLGKEMKGGKERHFFEPLNSALEPRFDIDLFDSCSRVCTLRI